MEEKRGAISDILEGLLPLNSPSLYHLGSGVANDKIQQRTQTLCVISYHRTYNQFEYRKAIEYLMDCVGNCIVYGLVTLSLGYTVEYSTCHVYTLNIHVA